MEDKKKSDLTNVLFVLQNRMDGSAYTEKIPQIDNSWAVQITDNCDEAKELLRSQSFDVLICDDELSNDTGISVIESCRQVRPSCLGFLRKKSQPSNEESLALSQKKIFYLPGNLEEEGIYSHISRRILLRSLSENPNLLSVIRRMKKMPTIPQLYHQITRELHKEDGSIEFVAGLISKEPSMSTRILKAVNSPVYGLGYEITEVVHALLFLGKDATQAQILADSVFSSYPSDSLAGIELQKIWKHSINVSAIARHISLQIETNKKASEIACTAGVIHDLGKVLMAANLPDHYAQAVKLAKDENMPLVDAEQKVFGTNHAEVAASLMGLWAIPFKILNSVAYHHNPVGGPKSPPIATMALYMANGIDNAKTQSPLGQKYSEEMIDQWGFANEFSAWVEEFSSK